MSITLTFRSDTTLDVAGFVNLWPAGLLSSVESPPDNYRLGSRSSASVHLGGPPYDWSRRFDIAYRLLMVMACDPAELADLQRQLADAYPRVVLALGGRGWVSQGDEAWFHWTDRAVTVNTVLDERREVYQSFVDDGRFEVTRYPFTPDEGYPDDPDPDDPDDG